jgi:hypothetical protein
MNCGTLSSQESGYPLAIQHSEQSSRFFATYPSRTSQARWRSIIVLALLHAAFFWMLATSGPTPVGGTARQQRQTVLVPLHALHASPRPATSDKARATTSARQSAPKRGRTTPEAASLRRLPIPPPTVAPITPNSTSNDGPARTPSSAASAAPTSPPLDLTIRPGTSAAERHNPALTDPRANTSRPAAPEARMANRLRGDLPYSEEPLADGSRRIRQGGHCYVLHPSRASQLFSGNDQAGRAAGTVEPC